jgi:hypothetical protein
MPAKWDGSACPMGLDFQLPAWWNRTIYYCMCLYVRSTYTVCTYVFEHMFAFKYVDIKEYINIRIRNNLSRFSDKERLRSDIEQKKNLCHFEERNRPLEKRSSQLMSVKWVGETEKEREKELMRV